MSWKASLYIISLSNYVCSWKALTTCWEMRNCISESLAMIYMLPYFKRDFKSWCKEISKNKIEVWELHAAKVELQIEFFARLLHVIDRRVRKRLILSLFLHPIILQ